MARTDTERGRCRVEHTVRPCTITSQDSVLRRRYDALFFIAHGSRRVWLAGCTANPTGAWVTQQARNLGLEFSTRGLAVQAGLLRHELEHARQREAAPEAFALYELVSQAVGLRLNRVVSSHLRAPFRRPPRRRERPSQLHR